MRRLLPARLPDYELSFDDAANTKGDLVHFALLVDDEPINHDKALQ